MPELMVELKGTPRDVQAMIDVSHKAGAKTTRKQRVADNFYRLWFEGEPGDEGDFMRALKRRAGLVKSTRTRKSKLAPSAKVTETEGSEIPNDDDAGE